MDLRATLNEAAVFVCRKSSSAFSRRRKLRILFSRKDDWEPFIRRDFRYSGHELTFGDIRPETMKGQDLVVPIAIDDILYLNEVRHLVRGNPIPIPTSESVLLCDDKILFNNTLIENKFERIIPRMGKDLKFPYILKKRVDGFGANSHIVTGKDVEEKLQDEISSREYFCQEIVCGDKEYTTHLVYSRGKIIKAITIEYGYNTDIFVKGKIKPLYLKKIGNDHLELFRSVLDLVGFEGLCCFNYKIIKDRLFLLEINPRFGASLSNHFYSFVKEIF